MYFLCIKNVTFIQVAERNPELRQLWYAMPGEQDGEIVAYIQITMSAHKSCGDDCKFTVYYEPLDKSQVLNSILFRA